MTILISELLVENKWTNSREESERLIQKGCVLANGIKIELVDTTTASDDCEVTILFNKNEKINRAYKGREQLYTWETCWKHMIPSIRENIIDKFLYTRNPDNSLLIPVLSSPIYFVLAYEEEYVGTQNKPFIIPVE